MSSGARIKRVLAPVVVLLLACVLLSCGDDDDEPATSGATTTSAATTTPSATDPEPAVTSTTSEPPAADHEADVETINVASGKPDGGVQTITVKSGARAHIQVASQDTSDEVHIHGYDLKRQLKARDSVRFEFVADAEGIFEIELEGSHTQIGKLVVEP